MFVYQKKLQYPVRIKNTNPKLASLIISQYGGPECQRGGRESVPEFVKKKINFYFYPSFHLLFIPTKDSPAIL